MREANLFLNLKKFRLNDENEALLAGLAVYFGIRLKNITVQEGF